MVGVLALVPLCFAAGMLWGPWLIGQLRDRRLGKQIRLEGQEHHLGKSGTPTMGGILFVVTGLAAMVLFVREPRVVVPFALGVLLFALFGAYDDYANIRSREGLGLSVRAQIAVQLGFGLAVGWVLHAVYGLDAVRLPGFGPLLLGVWIVPFAAFVMLATTAGSNVIDGLDGLAGGTVAFAFLAYCVIALRRGDLALAGVCAAMIGALLAFLWFNVHPARVFMGGVGCLALGAGLAVVALISGEVLVLPIVALPLVVDLVSVMLQVGYFKATGGKRIFRRAPIHHHFELAGLPEVNVVFRFWLVAAVSAAAGLLLSEL